MTHFVDLPNYSIRTDLAREAHALAKERWNDQSEIPGVRSEEWEEDGILTSWIWIEDDQGGHELGKIPGTYLTIEVPALRSRDSLLEQRVAQHLAKQFSKFLEEAGVNPDDEVLLVGLGNWNVTADAVGPLVIKHSLVTRHLFTLAPDQVSDGYRSVSALSPGVLGITGIETSDIVKGVVERIRPDVVICFDALASRALSRVNTTIQIADTGIHPGSGVGNKRKALDRETLGVPVIAVGIPTVVDAATITHDAIDLVVSYLSQEIQGKRRNPLDPWNRPTLREVQSHMVPEKTRQQMLGMIGTLSPEEKREMIHQILSPLGQNLIVTPKEVDDFVANIAKLVANGVNCALHEAVTLENITSHVQ
jgi:spore protease